MRLGRPRGAGEGERGPAPGAGPEAAAAAAAAAVATAPPVAVLVVHGMGQQSHFETLDGVVRGLQRTLAAEPGGVPAGVAQPTVRLARVGGVDLPRVELTLPADPARGRPERECHLYEAYWAPLTEGRVTLRDVMSFLWSAGVNGRRNAKADGGFKRWMFGRFVQSPTPPRTAGHLLLALVVLGALLLVNATVTAALAGTLVKARGWAGIRDVLHDAGLVVGPPLLAIALVTGLLFWTRSLVWFFVILGLVVVMGLGSLALLVGLPDGLGGGGSSWLVAAGALAGGVLGVATLLARRLLVQYLGDVAAYVSSHRLDRFQDLRDEIRRVVGGVARAVYAHREPGAGAPAYERIAVFAHSLGSVAAYDALNAQLNADDLAPAAERVGALARTCLFLSFGSPLDKTAFLFKSHGHAMGETREALAAAVQPLIQDYAFRTFPWINVSSRQDIISGALDLYDDPGHTPAPGQHKVTNLEDPDARTPLAAHVEYWKNPTVFRHLLAHL